MLGERLHRARRAAGLSLREVASETGLSHTTIRKWEQGELKPSSSQLIQLAKLYGVRTEYFFRPLYRGKADSIEQAERWQELLSLLPQPPMQELGEPSAQEQAALFEPLVYQALADDSISESKAAELLQLPLATFHRQRSRNL